MVANTNHVGIWEPHSSSIDFCEPNYVVSPYVAEFHNAWSSLFIALIALVGYLHGNPIREKRNLVMFGILFFIGIGSVGLHTTLHWLPQSFDEIPMLWECWSLLFCMAEYNVPFGKRNYTNVIAMTTAVILQTIVYYLFRQFYIAFLVSYIALILVIAIWLAKIVFEHKQQKIFQVLYLLWIRALVLYIMIASVIWVIDNKFCSELLPYYTPLGGATFHILWHFAAGYACFHTITLLIACRLHYLKYDVVLQWILGFIPVCRISSV